MKIIGLVGGSGAGKSVFCEILSRRGIVTVDCDAISHAVQEKGTPCFLELVDRFGGEILFPDGNVNRAALASVVFSDEEALADLNRIMHKHILDALRRRLEELSETERMVVVEAPVLFESGFDKQCDLIVAITSTRKQERIMERDKLTAPAADARLENQISDEELAEKCDLVLVNDSALLHLEEEADRMLAFAEQTLFEEEEA